MKNLLLIMGIFLFANFSHASNDQMTEEYLEIINDYRVSIGLHPLELDEEMSEVALKHSKEMAVEGAPFSHDGFSLRCLKSRKIMGKGNLCGEIIANGQKTAERVFSAWMHSPGHRAKIVEDRYTHTGFGYYRNKAGKIYWTQIFMEVK